MNTTNHRPARCEGGSTGSCTSRATWSVRLPGDPDHAANLACGQHLHFAADHLTGGERITLDLRRILADER